MGPPRALNTALALFGMESINLLMVSGVKSLQTLYKTNSMACWVLAWGHTALLSSLCSANFQLDLNPAIVLARTTCL